MPLSEQDRETIELIATRISEKQLAAVEALIEQHRATCPYGRQLLGSRWLLVGLIVGLSAGGSALGNILIQLLRSP